MTFTSDYRYHGCELPKKIPGYHNFWGIVGPTKKTPQSPGEPKAHSVKKFPTGFPYPADENTMPNMKDIPQLLGSDSKYQVNVSWSYLGQFLQNEEHASYVLQPDFQRDHVWTQKQQIAYIEYKLQGGRGCNEVVFASQFINSCSTDMDTWLLVDGLQRITAVQKFLRDEIPAFGYLLSEYSHTKGMLRTTDFVVRVIETDYAGALEIYLGMNAGGTPHTAEEIQKVRKMLKEIKK